MRPAPPPSPRPGGWRRSPASARSRTWSRPPPARTSCRVMRPSIEICEAGGVVDVPEQVRTDTSFQGGSGAPHFFCRRWLRVRFSLITAELGGLHVALDAEASISCSSARYSRSSGSGRPRSATRRSSASSRSASSTRRRARAAGSGSGSRVCRPAARGRCCARARPRSGPTAAGRGAGPAATVVDGAAGRPGRCRRRRGRGCPSACSSCSRPGFWPQRLDEGADRVLRRHAHLLLELGEAVGGEALVDPGLVLGEVEVRLADEEVVGTEAARRESASSR